MIDNRYLVQKDGKLANYCKIVTIKNRTKIHINDKTMKDKYPILSLASLAIVTSCQDGRNNKKDTNETPPNIIFIVSEDNSPFLGCYGDPNANTPNLDKLAEEGILYENAFAVAPVSAPSRSSIITGMYASSLGSHHMRSHVTIPDNFHFFPYYLRKAGYYTVNRIKKDYNIVDQDDVWDDDQWWEYTDMLKNRDENQPFFVMFNTFMSHEGKIHGDRNKYMLPYYKNESIESITGTPATQSRIDSFNYMHEPGSVPVPPYHPKTPEMKEDWARYYDCMSMMDDEIGALLANLKRDGLLENTIIMYFSDHGGVLGRSKRFIFESGLHVPFIVRFPEKYKHLAPAKSGSRTNRIITLLDLAPTVLNLANTEIPDHFQGIPFLGPDSDTEHEYAFGFRGRMDERYDFSRTVRNKKFRYIKNYMPHRPWGQHINYLWKAKSMKSWEQAYLDNNTNEYQSIFWEPKPAEELYDIENDPHNIHNIAYDPQYKEILEEMRQANDEWLLSINDKNFIPEGEYLKNVQDTNGFEYFVDDNYDINKIKQIAETASAGKQDNIPALKAALKDNDPIVRYWGAVGCCILKEKSIELKKELLITLNDPSLDVRISSAEALYFMHHKEDAKKALKEILDMQDEADFSIMEMVRTHALNVIDIMQDEDKEYFKEQINAIAKREEKGYDQRMAEYLLTRF